MSRQDDEDARALLRKISKRVADMNKYMINAYSICQEDMEKSGGVTSSGMNSIKHNIRMYDEQRERLDKEVEALQQLMNR